MLTAVASMKYTTWIWTAWIAFLLRESAGLRPRAAARLAVLGISTFHVHATAIVPTVADR